MLKRSDAKSSKTGNYCVSVLMGHRKRTAREKTNHVNLILVTTMATVLKRIPMKRDFPASASQDIVEIFVRL